MADEDPIRVERTAPREHGAPMRTTGDNLPAVLAHRLAFWSKDGSGLLTLTFAEERAQLSDPGVRELHVCARVAMPMQTLEDTIRFLESARSAHVFAGSAPSTSTVN